jgi:hypothetical protein
MEFARKRFAINYILGGLCALDDPPVRRKH